MCAGGDVPRFPRHPDGSTLWLTLLLGHNPNRSRGVVGIVSTKVSVLTAAVEGPIMRWVTCPACVVLSEFRKGFGDCRSCDPSWFPQVTPGVPHRIDSSCLTLSHSVAMWVSCFNVANSLRLMYSRYSGAMFSYARYNSSSSRYPA